jgi:hypothetical protein
VNNQRQQKNVLLLSADTHSVKYNRISIITDISRGCIKYRFNVTWRSKKNLVYQQSEVETNGPRRRYIGVHICFGDTLIFFL